MTGGLFWETTLETRKPSSAGISLIRRTSATQFAGEFAIRLRHGSGSQAAFNMTVDFPSSLMGIRHGARAIWTTGIESH